MSSGYVIYDYSWNKIDFSDLERGWKYEDDEFNRIQEDDHVVVERKMI